MIKTKNIAMQCPQCDHTDFEQPDNVQDDDFVKCIFSGHQIMHYDLKGAGIEQAKQAIIPEAKKEIGAMLNSDIVSSVALIL